MECNDVRVSFNDIRVMTLKRWNLPQTQRIFGSDMSEKKQLGQFVSYCTHHFIDVSEARSDGSEVSSLPDAYKLLADHRKEMRVALMQDIHTVQSMTLIGPATTFWNTPTNILYITFIQLSNSDISQYAEISNQIEAVLKKRDTATPQTDPQFALYYSLDFCDMVLFTKDVSFDDIHDALWDITLIREGAFKKVRDTFTISCFEWDYLYRCFNAFEVARDGEVEELWKDTLSVSVNLNVQSLASWNCLKEKLKNKVSIVEHRLPGRHDINFTSESISGTQVLRIIYEIDKLCVKDVTQTFGSYEIVLQASKWTQKDPPDIADYSGELKETAAEALEKLCKKYSGYFPEDSDYVYETKRSLEELLKNGFSNEFVMSVLPSFIGYLRIGIESKERRETGSSLRKKIDEDFGRIRRRYYTALNTLSLCTMHNERQFIQAPSFNASYFEIPPKVLAFYSAISYDVATKLNDSIQGKEEADGTESCSCTIPYRFIITPDYRKDIFVEPLQICCTTDTQDHLAIINLCEQYFYDPTKAVMLLAHEIGHFVGNRKRKARSKLIYKAISLQLLSASRLVRTVPSNSNKIAHNDLIMIFAAELGDYMAELAEKNCTSERKIANLLSDISKFAIKHKYGVALFSEPLWFEEIEHRWRKALCQCLKDNDHSSKLRTQLLEGLKSIQDESGSTFLTNASSTNISESVIEIFTRSIATEIRSLGEWYYSNIQDYHKKRDSFFDTCKCIINSFSEAYADLRLCEICGNSFSFDRYRCLLHEINTEDVKGRAIRLSAIARMTNTTCDSKDDMSVAEIMTNSVVDIVCEYLELCRDASVRSEMAEETLRTFASDDLFAQCRLIDSYIDRYRKTLIEFLKSNS